MTSKKPTRVRGAKKKSKEDERINKCHYCKDKIVGLPHYCKFCGEKHCDNHILPEDHNCPDVKRNKWAGNNYAKKHHETIPTVVFEPHSVYIPKKQASSSKKKQYHEHSKTNKKDYKHKVKHEKKFSFKLIMIILAFIVLAYVIYANWDKISESFNIEENQNIVIETSKIDNLSSSAMDYLNRYREDNGVKSIDISEELYLGLIGLSNEIRQNPDKYPRPFQMIEYLKNETTLPEYNTFFIKSYAIRGGGIDRFKKNFDEKYMSRNLVAKESYNYGAIGCNLDYCIIALFEQDGDIPETNKIQEVQPEQPIREDIPLEKCRLHVEDVAAAEVMSSSGDFAYKIEEHKTFESKSDLKSYITKYQTSNQYIKICSDEEEFISFLVVFEYQGNNPYFADRYTEVLICDEYGNTVSKSYSC